MQKRSGVGLLLVFCFLIATSVEPTVHGDDDAWWYCDTTDSNQTAYFSEVFKADNSDAMKSSTYTLAFDHFVEANYKDSSQPLWGLGATYCLSHDQRGEARSARDGSKATDEKIYKKVIQTDWTY